MPDTPPISRGGHQSWTPFFQALRRMRPALLAVIIVFAVSVLGMTLVPGVETPEGVRRLTPFEAFYFMSYTATTIGFGELPGDFTPALRLWVTFCIYASVITWAYAFGKIISLVGDRGFRESLQRVRFEREVRLLHEPFLLIAGYGRAGQHLANSLDAIDRRMVVVDPDPERIAALEVAPLRNDVPALSADIRNPQELRRAGLLHPMCAGLVALSGEDETNLAAVMTAWLLRPDLPVVTRSSDPAIERRLAAAGSPLVVDPFRLFADELVAALRSPDLHRLLRWLSADPGTDLEPRLKVPLRGRWVVAGYGRFGSRLVHDLLSVGLEVTVITKRHVTPVERLSVLISEVSEFDDLERAGITEAVAFAAATDNDITNLSMLASARAANPGLFLVGRQNEPANTLLFEAMALDSLLVPTALVAREVLQRVGSPLLWRFVQAGRQRDERWAASLLERLTSAMGESRDSVWDLRINAEQCPAVLERLRREGPVTIGHLLADPEDRDVRVPAVPLLLQRGGTDLLTPTDHQQVRAGDRLLLAGTHKARSTIETTVTVPAALAYTATGERVGNSWVWRTFVDK